MNQKWLKSNIPEFDATGDMGVMNKRHLPTKSGTKCSVIVCYIYVGL